MNTKNIAIIVGLIVLVGVGFAFTRKTTAPVDSTTVTTPDATTTTDTTTPATPDPSAVVPVAPTPVVTAPTTFTLAQIATHKTEADCYSAIDGKVYDLGAWVKQHPGGDKAILSICGKDGSKAFNGQHGGQSDPKTMLAGFEIGLLK